MIPTKVSIYLQPGRKNAQTGRSLAKFFNCDIRLITAAIRRERLQGIPICATSDHPAGYYLAETDEEIQDYCNRLLHRGRELFGARAALLKRLKEGSGERATSEEDASK